MRRPVQVLAAMPMHAKGRADMCQPGAAWTTTAPPDARLSTLDGFGWTHSADGPRTDGYSLCVTPADD